MSIAVIGAGSNLGGREAAIRGAGALLDARSDVVVLAMSPLYETPPLGPPQDDYLNAAFRVETTCTPPELLRVLLGTERRLGRKRSADRRWGPRSIDLDLLWDSRGPHRSAGLEVPHAELERRAFALAPLLDVAPELGRHYAGWLDEAGGRPPLWSRAALVRQSALQDGLERIVEADCWTDACALAATFDLPHGRPWSTRQLRLAPAPERFADALQDLLRGGFEVHRATISHCSQSQWTVEFHGVHRGFAIEADVRLRTTSSDTRECRVELRTTPRK